jgi:hypothetical protein
VLFSAGAGTVGDCASLRNDDLDLNTDHMRLFHSGLTNPMSSSFELTNDWRVIVNVQAHWIRKIADAGDLRCRPPKFW